MICNSCGAKNSDDNVSCSVCGEELTSEVVKENVEKPSQSISHQTVREKYCPECGAKNLTQNKFCIECGNKFLNDELFEEEEIADQREGYCVECGFENDEESTFCQMCGNQLKTEAVKSNKSEGSFGKERKEIHQPKKKQHHIHQREIYSAPADRYKKSYPQPLLSQIKPSWIALGVVVVSLLVYLVIKQSSAKSLSADERQFPVERISSNPVIEKNVVEVASKFVCSCGTCNAESLEKCTCPTAVEEREMIRDYLQQSMANDKIVLAVANKYGWMKAEFASKYKVEESKIYRADKTGTIKVPDQTLNNAFTSILASYANKEQIYFSLKCPCGQCNIEELKECNCSHPGGAKEIKNFIDQKIAEQKYSVQQIIDEVDKTYKAKKNI
jgi:cytochrome c-type biogenesis protein CcmH/NrfF/predicted amidophosphoribosyltransferase